MKLKIDEFDLRLIELGDSEKRVEDDESRGPIHIVTAASQLPVEFLEPSPQSKLVIGFDCEGVDLCRKGTLCVMQVHSFSRVRFRFIIYIIMYVLYAEIVMLYVNVRNSLLLLVSKLINRN